MRKVGAQKLNKSLRLIAQSSLIVLVGIVLSKAITYLYRILIARSFGPEIYGLFTLALMIITFFVMFASLGLPEGLLRYLAFYRGKKEILKARYLFRTSIIVLTITGVVAGCALFFLARTISIGIFHNELLIPFLQIFGIALPFSIIAGGLLSSLLAFEQIGWNSFINNFFQNFLKVVILLSLIWLGFGGNAVMLSYALGIFGMFVLSYFVTKKTLPELYRKQKLSRKARGQVLREVIGYSWPIIFLSTVYTLFGWTDSFVIGYFMDATNVGFYNAAFTLIALFGIAPELFKQLFFPLIVKEYSRNNLSLIRELSQQVGKWTFILNLPLFFLMILFPGAIINILFGPEYLVASGVLQVLAIGGIFSSLNTVLINLLSMKGKTKIILANMMIIAVVDLILNIIFVPRFGLYGAAISTGASLSLLGLILLIQVKVYVKIIPLRRKMLRVALVALAPLLALAFVKEMVAINAFTLFVFGTLFIITYIILIFITGCLDRNDWMIVHTFKDRIFQRKNTKL